MVQIWINVNAAFVRTAQTYENVNSKMIRKIQHETLRVETRQFKLKDKNYFNESENMLRNQIFFVVFAIICKVSIYGKTVFLEWRN